MNVDEMESKRSENKPFSLAAYQFENCLLSPNICNKIKYLSVDQCTNCTGLNYSLTTNRTVKVERFNTGI